MKGINMEMDLDPDKREWEYDGTGAKIYKLEAGKPTKTPYADLDGGVPFVKEKPKNEST